jgi:phenylacetate-CoA ligase
MHQYARLARHVMVPTLDYFRGTRTAKRMAELERSQWWPLEKLHEEQTHALTSLVTYAFSQVPYYRRLASELGLESQDIRTPEDLTKLPLMTKDIVHEHLQDILAEDYPPSQLRASWTGGTTGSRLHFYTTRDYQLSWALPRWLRSMEMQGSSIGDPHVSIRQMIARRTSTVERVAHAISARFQRVVRLDSMTVTEGNLASIADAIDRASPCTLAAYPSSLALIAQYYKDSRRRPPHILASMIGGEQLLPHQRTIVREVFGNEPYLRYGSNELQEVAAECPARRGLHLSIEDFIVEVVDDRGQPVPAGQEGTLVITNLRNYGMPLIRYAIGDIGSLMPCECSCGRTLPLLSPVVARHIDFLYTRDGQRIAPMQLDMSPVLSLGITQFRIVQHEYNRVSVTLVPDRVAGQPRDTTAASLATERTLRKYLGEKTEVDVQFAERIEMNISGKRLAIMSKIPRVGSMQ